MSKTRRFVSVDSEKSNLSSSKMRKLESAAAVDFAEIFKRNKLNKFKDTNIMNNLIDFEDSIMSMSETKNEYYDAIDVEEYYDVVDMAKNGEYSPEMLEQAYKAFQSFGNFGVADEFYFIVQHKTLN